MKPEVIVRIFNGLGNQLFQYAAGRALALRYNTKLKMDLSWFGPAQERKYRLDKFNIRANVVTANDLEEHFGHRSGPHYQSFYFRMRENLCPAESRRLVTEENFHVQENLLRIKPPVYLNGCWQSEKYFSNYSDYIHQEITLVNAPDQYGRKWLDKICCDNSVCVHVRRGDYVSNNQFNQIHGTCEPEYYRRARDMITDITKNPKFYVFSDDIEWAKRNLTFLSPVIWVDDGNSENDHEDFRLMCACRHFIIANSSLSWWAAWSGSYSKKAVVAPISWFRTQARDTKDLFPGNWYVI